MTRLETVFRQRRDAGRSVLVTYLVAGDPEPGVTVDTMHALAAGGAEIIELGVPFTDPEADGPDIQAGVERALRHRVRLADVLAMVREFRSRDADTAVVLMGYLNSVEAMGYERFATEAAAAGVDGVLLVNLPPEENDELGPAMARSGVDQVFLLAPTTTAERAERILGQATGFAYYVSLKGTTGSGGLEVDAVRARLAELRRLSSLPIAVGFGIRDADSARQVAAFADGVVVGSALVRRMGDLAATPERIPEAAGAFARTLREAMDAA